MKLRITALLSFLAGSFIGTAQTVSSDFQAIGLPSAGIFSTTVPGSNITYNGVVKAIIAETFDGQPIDFDGDGNREVVMQFIGSATPMQAQTRVFIYEAEGNNNYALRADYLIADGQNAGYDGNAAEYHIRGLDVGDLDGNAATIEIAVGAGGLPNGTDNDLVANDGNFHLNILSVSTTFAVSKLANRLIYGRGSNPAKNNAGHRGATVDIKIVPSKQGTANNDIILGGVFNNYSDHAVMAWEYNGTSIVKVGNSISEPQGIHVFETGDFDNDGDIEIIYWPQGASLRISEYTASGFSAAERTQAFDNTSLTYVYQILKTDLDSDGFQEILISNIGSVNPQTGSIGILKATGANTYSWNSIAIANSRIGCLAVADMDRDGLKEIVYNRNTDLLVAEHDGSAGINAVNFNFPGTAILTNFFFSTGTGGLPTGGTTDLNFQRLRSSARAIRVIDNFDGDNNSNLFVAGGRHQTNPGFEYNELFFLEATRDFTGGNGFGTFGTTPTAIPAGNYDVVRAGAATTLAADATINGYVTGAVGSAINTGAFTLTLDATSTSRYATLDKDIAVTSNLRVEKVMTSTAQGWRQMTFPVGTTLGGINFATNGMEIRTKESILNPATRNVYFWNAADSLAGQAFGWKLGANADDQTKSYALFWHPAVQQLAASIQLTGNASTAADASWSVFNTSADGTAAPAAQGWNMVGNPWPSNVNVSTLISTNLAAFTYKFIHVWDHAAGQYRALGTGTSTNFGPNGTGGASQGPGIIAPYQAFWVKANANTTFTLSKNTINTTAGAQIFAKTSTPNLVRLNVRSASNNTVDQLVVDFNPAATWNLDGEYDAFKINSMDGTVPTLSAEVDGSPVAIAGIPAAQGGLWLNFKPANGHNQHVFELNTDELQPGIHIYLVDHATGKNHDLMAGPYAFQQVASAPENRFELRFEPATTLGADQPTATAPAASFYAANGQLHILPGSARGKATLRITDLAGRVIQSKKLELNGTEQVIPVALQGIYIATLEGADFNTAAKVPF